LTYRPYRRPLNRRYRLVSAALILLLAATSAAFVLQTRQGEPQPSLILSATTLPSSAAPASITAAPDPACASGCIIRVTGNPQIPTLWQHGDIAYAVADATMVASLRSRGSNVAIVAGRRDTTSLYALSAVPQGSGSLIDAVGTVLDHVSDVRLVDAAKLPLQVAALSAAGVLVEKIRPSCAGSDGTTPFSSSQTLNEIVKIGTSLETPAGDREYDSPGTVMAAAYLYCRFAALGLAVHYADFLDGQGHQQLNVVAQSPNRSLGADTTLVTAHYDTISPTKQSAPGADDNASGVTAMLDIASRNAQTGFRSALGFVAFAAEEPGLLGSRAFTMRLAHDGVQLKAVINLDAIGIPDAGKLTIIGDTASRLMYTQLVGLSTDNYQLLWTADRGYLNGDDEYFRRNGYIAIMVTTHLFGTEPVHHTEQDVVGNLDFGQIAAITDLVWRWIVLQPS